MIIGPMSPPAYLGYIRSEVWSEEILENGNKMVTTYWAE
jgi:hypothetical protein